MPARAIEAAHPHAYSHASPLPLDWALVLGLAHWQLQNYQDALAALDRVEQGTVQDPTYFTLLGMVCRRVKGLDGRAMQAYQSALDLDPDRADIHYNLANLVKDSDPRLAIQHYRSSLKLEPMAASSWHNYGSTLNEQEDLSGSLQALQCSLQLDPFDADAWCNLGLTYFQLEQFDASKACFCHSISLDQQHARSHINYGQVLIETLQPEQAYGYLLRGAQLDDSSSNSLWNLSLAMLLLGQYKEGWRYYEARFHTPDFERQPSPTAHDLPRELDALPGPGDSELIVWSEQGVGDGIQFCRYLHLLESRQVPFRLLAHKPLVPLYRDWMRLGDRVSVKLDTKADHDPRPNIAMLSLPLLFGTELFSVPCFTPYLHPPGPPPNHLQVRRPPGGLAVGVVWASNPGNRAMYRRKSIPADQLLPPLIDLIRLDLIEVHSLQVGADAGQLEPWRKQERLFDWNGTLQDFSDTAHVIQQLDLIISVDTAVAHLAGALNKPTWLLLPHNADFRWLHQTQQSPWYPTMRLFRQHDRGNWGSVMSDVQAALDDLFILDLKALAGAKLSS